MAEYEKMFMLQFEDLVGKRVLDVAGGASSFTTEARQRGIHAEAVDPLYAKSPDDNWQNMVDKRLSLSQRRWRS